MAKVRVFPSKLKGSLKLPPSKSQTLRALLFAALSSGTSRIENPLSSPDTKAMLTALEALGAQIHSQKDAIEITGVSGKLTPPQDAINCGNSGLVLRLIGALAGLIPASTTLTGDHSIQTSRPVKPLLDGLSQLGAEVHSHNQRPPITIQGPLTKTTAHIDGCDSQPVSGLLIASAFAPHPIQLHVENPKEKPWIDLTLHWFDKLGIPYQKEGYTHYSLQGNTTLSPFTYTTPADWSSAAFPLSAALLTQSELSLSSLSLQEPQGDKILLSYLSQMGAQFTHDNDTLHIQGPSSLQGISIDMDASIDALPILSVIGCFASGKTHLYNAKIARSKESDRIACMAQELKKMGAHLEEKEDGLILYTSSLKGANLDSHRDHRIAMSLIVAALAAKGPSTITGVECIAKTYPRFCEELIQLGAHIECAP